MATAQRCAPCDIRVSRYFLGTWWVYFPKMSWSKKLPQGHSHSTIISCGRNNLAATISIQRLIQTRALVLLPNSEALPRLTIKLLHSTIIDSTVIVSQLSSDRRHKVGAIIPDRARAIDAIWSMISWARLYEWSISRFQSNQRWAIINQRPKIANVSFAIVSRSYSSAWNRTRRQWRRKRYSPSRYRRIHSSYLPIRLTIYRHMRIQWTRTSRRRKSQKMLNFE